MSRPIIIPLQPVTVITGPHQGEPLVLPEDMALAIDAWYHIKDDAIADTVADRIQERINERWLQTHF